MIIRLSYFALIYCISFGNTLSAQPKLDSCIVKGFHKNDTLDGKIQLQNNYFSINAEIMNIGLDTGVFVFTFRNGSAQKCFIHEDIQESIFENKAASFWDNSPHTPAYDAYSYSIYDMTLVDTNKLFVYQQKFAFKSIHRISFIFYFSYSIDKICLVSPYEKKRVNGKEVVGLINMMQNKSADNFEFLYVSNFSLISADKTSILFSGVCH